MVDGFEYKYDNVGWRSYVGTSGTNTPNRLFVALLTNNIGVYNSDTSTSVAGQPFRILLKKIS